MTRQSTSGSDSRNPVSVLSVSPSHEDHAALEAIFSHSKWKLFRADRLAPALRILEEYPVGVVLCERHLAPVAWTDLLERLDALHHSPPLIVTARLADERLWSEALNLGAYDVLAKPFDRLEVVRSVSVAWLHWLRRNESSRRSTRVMRAAS